MSSPIDRGRRDGKVLRGVHRSKRHLFDWDLGKGLGMFCRKCGVPKPPFTEDETHCIGRYLATTADLLKARGESIPNFMFSLAWVRQLNEQKFEMHPDFIMASKAAFKAPLIKFGHEVANEQLNVVIHDATSIYRTVSADVDAYAHHMAVCYFATKLSNDGHVDTTNQCALMGVAILREADSSQGMENFSVPTVQMLAGDMIRAARKLGYYGGGASSLRLA